MRCWAMKVSVVASSQLCCYLNSFVPVTAPSHLREKVKLHSKLAMSRESHWRSNHFCQVIISATDDSMLLTTVHDVFMFLLQLYMTRCNMKLLNLVIHIQLVITKLHRTIGTSIDIQYTLALTYCLRSHSTVPPAAVTGACAVSVGDPVVLHEHKTHIKLVIIGMIQTVNQAGATCSKETPHLRLRELLCAGSPAAILLRELALLVLERYCGTFAVPLDRRGVTEIVIPTWSESFVVTT